MSELLIELFSEEIPARMQSKAAGDFEELFLQGLKKYNFEAEQKDFCKVFVTPRRLTLYVSDLPEQIRIEAVEKRGPKLSAPEQALAGFMRSVGVDNARSLEEKDGYYYYRQGESKVGMSEILPQILPEILNKLSSLWPKSMFWQPDHKNLRWVRPLRNILVLFDGKIIDFSFFHLKANDQTYAHRFLSDNEPKQVKNFADYEKFLRKNCVILDQEERLNMIISQMDAMISPLKCNLIPADINIVKNSSLINEVNGLVEYPVALLGEIDQEFMKLPPEILITTLKSHQKYFCLFEQDGKLSRNFITISNISANDNELVKIGNQKVLRARLSDAKFFVDEDLKISLEKRQDELKNIIFHKKIGTILEKTQRISKLASYLNKNLKIGLENKLIEQAAKLCKADLTTNLVAELPELQGFVGSYYASQEKLNKKLCDSIADHYLPNSQASKLPRNELGNLLAISDKIDSIVSLFAANEKPTSSRDPFAIRRATLGIIRIVIENEYQLDLPALIQESKKILPKDLANQKVEDDILSFFNERLKVYLKDASIDPKVIAAIFAGNQNQDILLLVNKANCLNEALKDEKYAKLLALYRRVSNISKTKAKNNAKCDQNLLTLPAEQNLYKKFQEIKPKYEANLTSHQFKESLEKLLSLEEVLEKFFAEILVEDEDQKLRDNRLALLSELSSLFDEIADFGCLI